MPPTTDDKRLKALAAFLKKHHQCIDTAKLRELKFPRDYALRQVAAGRWQKVHRGVYCAYTGPLSFLSRCAAALLACGPKAALAGPTAAQLQKLKGFDDQAVHVVIPHGTYAPKLKGVRVRQSVALSERSIRARQGLRTLRPEWTTVGVARLWPARARAVLAASVQQGLVLPEHLVACVLAIGRFPRCAALLTTLGDIAGGTRSELEDIFPHIVRSFGLALPATDLSANERGGG